MKLLITGLSGFVGSHMAELAIRHSVQVYGTIRTRSRVDNLTDVVLSRATLVETDLRDPVSTRRMIDQVRPTHVIHLAAQSFVGASWAQPVETITNNVIGQVNLLEAIRDWCVRDYVTHNTYPRILVIGSSEEYGMVDQADLPLTEDAPLRPMSPYGVSKVAQDLMGFQYWKSYGMPIIRTRAFNHEGPRRGEQFVTANFAKQIAEIEAGLKQPTVHVGNLEAYRDYTDVRDVVKAYWILLSTGLPGEVYNVCSGKVWRIGEVLDYMLHKSPVKDIKVVQEASRMRPSDVPELWGSAKKIRQQTVWKPTIAFEQTMDDTMAYWRDRVGPHKGTR